MRLASGGGSSEQNSSMPGLRNSVTVNGSPGFTPISAAMRAIRAGAILACATRLAYETPTRPDACVDGADRRQQVEIESRIGEVLRSGKSPHAGEHDDAGGLRHHDRALELGER